MQDFHVTNCNTDGIWSDGTDNVITGVEASHNIQGIEIGEHAKNNKVLRNYLHNNDKMWPNTPGAFDDSGAVGMVVVGDDTEVAYNTITDNIAPSADFGTDGSAVEIYGGIGTVVHHNIATNNRTFTELGNPRSADTTYAYNQVTSNLDGVRVPHHPRRRGLLRPGRRHRRGQQLGQAHRRQLHRLRLLRRLHHLDVHPLQQRARRRRPDRQPRGLDERRQQRLLARLDVLASS